MAGEKNLTIIIPAYYEADNLEHLLPEVVDYCRKNSWKIIVVDDGSKDKTPDILKRYDSSDDFSIIHHKLNNGYGAAIKSGLSACETAFAITIDGDGQHYLEDIEKLYNKMITSDADMVVGSRKGLKNASLIRRMGKSMIRNLARLLMSVPIHDIN